MGEYIRENKDGPQVAKLGTCESWGYIRRDECFLLREKGFVYDGNWKYIDSNDRQGPIFRFPWPSEDSFIKKGTDAIVMAMNNRDMNYQRCFSIPKELAFSFDHRDYSHSPRGVYCSKALFNNGNWQLPCRRIRPAQ